MSQVRRRSATFAVACALLAVFAVGCSKKNGVAFDPDAGHADDFFPTHSAEYKNAGGGCAPCHGIDLLGGISTVSCYSASRDGQSCHPDGPDGHPAGWRALHSADASKAATCAPCHDNPSNNLAPNCFDNSLCHGPKAGHPSGWRSSHAGTDPAQASSCADCHQSNPGAPGCFNNTLCHGAKSTHPAGWLATHQGTKPKGAAVCAGCHPDKGQPTCFSASACHGGGNHPAGWRTAHQSTVSGNAAVCAGCHADKGTPSCFSLSACHGGVVPHAGGWVDDHKSTNPNQAATCHNCHITSSGATPGCFNSTLCHGAPG